MCVGVCFVCEREKRYREKKIETKMDEHGSKLVDKFTHYSNRRVLRRNNCNLSSIVVARTRRGYIQVESEIVLVLILSSSRRRNVRKDSL